MTKGQFKTYADHNTVIFTGRVAAADIRQGKNGEFLSVALIHNPEDDHAGVELKFNTSAGLLGFVKKGYQLVGRQLTITAHLGGVESTYVNADGDTQLLQRPRLLLTNVSVMPGGIGAPPKGAATPKTTKVVVKPAQAKAQVSEPVTPEEAYSDNEADASVAPVDEVPAY